MGGSAQGGGPSAALPQPKKASPPFLAWEPLLMSDRSQGDPDQGRDEKSFAALVTQLVAAARDFAEANGMKPRLATMAACSAALSLAMIGAKHSKDLPARFEHLRRYMKAGAEDVIRNFDDVNDRAVKERISEELRRIVAAAGSKKRAAEPGTKPATRHVTQRMRIEVEDVEGAPPADRLEAVLSTLALSYGQKLDLTRSDIIAALLSVFFKVAIEAAPEEDDPQETIEMIIRLLTELLQGDRSRGGSPGP